MKSLDIVMQENKFRVLRPEICGEVEYGWLAHAMNARVTFMSFFYCFAVESMYKW